MSGLALLGGTPVRSTPFAAWPEYGEPEERAVVLALRSGHWGRTTGDYNDEFQRRLAAYQHAAYAVTCANGTAALELALCAAGIGDGDQVIIPSYTFIATASAVLRAGGTPVFADIDAATYTLSPASVESVLAPATRAVIPVHLAGSPADMDGILALARPRGIAVIEDAAQAVGAEWRDQRVGALGDLGTFSFQSSKVLTAGEGGAVVTNNAAHAETVWSLQNVGRAPGSEWYEHHRLGWNLRMTEFQAALLLAQIDRLDVQIARRTENAAHLDALLHTVKGIEPLEYPPQVTRHPRYLYIFKYHADAFGGVPKRQFVKALVAEGIPAMPGYPPLHTMPSLIQALKATGMPLRAGADGRLPQTDAAWADEGIWLPQTVLLGSRDDLADIGCAVEKIARHQHQLL